MINHNNNHLNADQSNNMLNIAPSTYAKFQGAFNPAQPRLDVVLSMMQTIQSANEKMVTPLPPIKYPVFQGGGAKGVAYVGAYQALEAQGYLEEITCPGGTSAGALPAFFMSLGFSAEQFAYISEHMNFMDFMDLKEEGWGAYFNGSKIGIAADLVHYGAASAGRAFHNMASYYIEQVLGDKHATFRDLHEKIAHDPALKDVLFTATHYGDSEHAQKVFSFETTPDVLIADALRATMSYPGAFEPWEVREKVWNVGNGYEFKSLGFHADGGILNNLPVDVYNCQAYRDPRFQFIERKDRHDHIAQVNPCVVGFSLTSLEELDEKITPMPARLKVMHKLATLDAKADRKTKPSSTWHFWDLLKAGYWNQVGKPEVEDIADKQHLYKEQMVQIWPDEITTLEFDVSQEKLARSVENGRAATKLWLETFHNPSSASPFEESFNPKWTKKEQQMKTANGNEFYYSQLKSLYCEFRRELDKQVKREQTEHCDFARNVNLQYLSGRILRMIEKLGAKDKQSIVEKAFADACQEYAIKSKTIEENHKQRWNLVLPDKILESICDQVVKQPEVALRMLKGQLTSALDLAKKNNGKLLRVLVRTNNAELVGKALAILHSMLQQHYYQSRIGDPNKALAKLLNNVKPSLMKMAMMRQNSDMAKVLSKYGVEMITVAREQADIVEELCQDFDRVLSFDTKFRTSMHRQGLIFSRMSAANVGLHDMSPEALEAVFSKMRI